MRLSQNGKNRAKSKSNEPIHKSPFTRTEDQIIIQFIMQNGPKNWAALAQQLEGRSAKQCRERWHNHLNPNINKGPWTYNEDVILAQKQKILGNRWADIARFLPGRNDTLVKNRWNTSVKDRADELLKGKTVKSHEQCDPISNFLQLFNRVPYYLPHDFQSIPPLNLNRNSPKPVSP